MPQKCLELSLPLEGNIFDVCPSDLDGRRERGDHSGRELGAQQFVQSYKVLKRAIDGGGDALIFPPDFQLVP